MRRLMLFAALVFAAGHALAQTPAPRPPAAPAPPATPATPATPQIPAPPALSAPEVSVPPRPRQAINIRVDITITEAGGSAPPVRKTVSTVAGDGFSGSVREVSAMSAPGAGPPTSLNVDASPSILPNDKIRVGYTIQYTAGQNTPSSDATARRTDIRLSQTMILDNGKTLKVWEGADPVATDRHVLIEATATILK